MKSSMILGNDNWEWEDYFLATGENFYLFWDKYLHAKKRNILFILGVGFDPRMCVAVENIMAKKGDGKRDCLLINFDEGEYSPSQKYQSNVGDNLKHIKEIFNERGIIKNEKVIMIGRDNRRTGSRNAANLSLEKSRLLEYTDIIVDISALPRVLYFPLIKKLLHIYDNHFIEELIKPNIHVVVAENPILDSEIRAEGIEDKADYIHGFRGDIELESTAAIPRIWLPLIGENREEHLKRIHTLIKPEEICPILPFPAINPRRGDDLLLEYRELLFDRLSIEPTNILYVSEQNPFEVYRKIVRTSTQYIKALESLGGCKIIVSALSSKILSIGALLAVYDLSKRDLKIGVAHIEAQGYAMMQADGAKALDDKQVLFSIWLKGECYED